MIKYEYPQDKYLKHYKYNDISEWKLIKEEWTGAREKFMVSPPGSNHRYIVKFPNYGLNETKIELFNCYLGINLNLDVASYFPCIYKGRKGVITKIFLGPNSELWEMKGLVCHYSNKPNLEEKFGRNPEVLKEHSIDNIFLILEAEFGDKVLQKFFSMVGFDCLIGHGDRHWTNYGVIVKELCDDLKYKFSPIYDTASGYLLELTDKQLKKMVRSGELDNESWHRPKKKGLCKITCNGDIKTNHIELFEYVLGEANFKRFAPFLIDPIKRFNLKLVRRLLKDRLLRNLTAERKFAIEKVLGMRKKILDSIIKGQKRC